MKELINHSHIVKYKTFAWVLLALLALTFTSVEITRINLGNLSVVGALMLATIKASLVLWYFMHLKYESRFYLVMVSMVVMVFLAVIVITFFDYSFR